MSEPTGPGMGRPSGPEFTGPWSGAPAPSAPPPVPPRRRRSGPPTSRLPTVLTVLALLVVGGIVVVASVWAGRQDVREATPDPAPTAASESPAATPSSDRIEFATSSGSGVLEIVDHGWDSDGADPDSPGSYLTVAVRITCASGVVGYGPDSFRAFDRTGALFEPAYVPDSPGALELGTLSAGQRVSGTVAFDIPRGGVTLLMSDEGSRTVTALKVPD